MDETPGFSCDNVQMLVLDEADRILDMGFKVALDAIVENLPIDRQTLLFSATQTKAVKDLVRLSLHEPEYIAVHEKAKHATPQKLTQNFIVTELEHKVNTVWSFIKTHLKAKSIIFLSTCKQVRYYHEVFCRMRPGIPLMALQGKQKQMKRLAIFYKFCEAPKAVLFATDIAARGLDFPAVNWVVQADCPDDVQTYIHRAGRTARLHAEGKALLVLLPSEIRMAEQLEQANIPLEQINVNSDRLQNMRSTIGQTLTADPELKLIAQKALVSYLRSYHLQGNKRVFDLNALPVEEFALSMGLPNAPVIKLPGQKKAKKAPAPKEEEPSEEEEASEEELEEEAEEEAEEEEGDLFQLKRKNHHLTGAEAEKEEEEEDEEPLQIAQRRHATPKRKKVTNMASGEKLVFDDDGLGLSKTDRIKRNSELVEARGELKLDPSAVADHVKQVAARMEKRDVTDKAVHQKRIREKHLDLKRKMRKMQGLEDGSDGDEGPVAILGGVSDQGDGSDDSAEEEDSDAGELNQGGSEDDDGSDDEDDMNDLANQEDLALQLLRSKRK